MATPLPNVPEVLKADLRWTWGSDASVHSHLFFHYTSGAPSQSDLTTFANAISASYTADLRAQATATVVLTQVTCTDLSTTATPQGVATVSTAGTKAGTTLTAQTALLMNLKVGRRYRGGHPRLYLPLGVSSDVTTAQSWTATFITAVNTAFNAFVTSLLGVGPPGPTCDHLVNVSYHSGGALRTTPLVDQIISYSANAIPASQRRRMNRSA